MAGKNQGGSNNPFDMLRNLGDLKDMRKLLGEDFFKNIPFPNMQQGAFSPNSDGDDDEIPRVDIYERGPEIIAVFEIPGISRATDVALSIGSDHIHVRGTISEPGYREDRVILSERYHGSFSREVSLPVRVIPDDVQATYRNGLLIVRLQKYGVDEGDTPNFVRIHFDDQENPGHRGK